MHYHCLISQNGMLNFCHLYIHNFFSFFSGEILVISSDWLHAQTSRLTIDEFRVLIILEDLNLRESQAHIS